MTSHIVHLVNDQDVPATALLQLLRRAFGGADSLWPANQRWLYWSDDTLVGHVSVQRRWFLVNQRYWEGWFVGGVCVDPTAQGHGYSLTPVSLEVHGGPMERLGIDACLRGLDD